jgi:hypothetical protein
LVAVTFGNGRYLAVGDNGTILSSSDAINWTRLAVTGTTARLNNVLYAAGKYIAVGEGGAIVVSTDGTTWSPTTSGVTGWLRGLAYGNGRWLAAGQGGAVTSSNDGFVWTKFPTSNSLDLEATVFTSSSTSSYTSGSTVVSNSYHYFLSVGADGTAQISYLYTSTQSGGTPSTGLVTPFINFKPETTARLRSLSVGNGVFVATGENGEAFSAQSPYGPWTRVATNTSANLVGAGFALGSLCLVGDSETILQSETIYRGRLGNLSTRGVAGRGANVMIAGTVVQGTRPKQFLFRAVGPGLTSTFGLTGTLTDPTLSVYNDSGTVVATNTGWGTNLNPASISAAARAVGAFDFLAGSRDSALIITLNPGNYTLQVAGAGGIEGIALVEAYDMDTINATMPRAINLSTRGQVGTGANILIAGLVVQGQSSCTLLLRGVGPTLGTLFPSLTGTLADPVIRILQNDGSILATNDNWFDSTTTNGRVVTADEIRTVTAACGAFPLVENSKDAAMLVTLVPGNYTIQVSGKNDTTGLALAEVYEVPSN